MKPHWLYADGSDKWVLGQACRDAEPYSVSGQVCYDAADAAAAFAAKHDLMLRGHTLFWPKHPLPKRFIIQHGDYIRKAYLVYIRGLVQRHPQAISWDVLNEPLSGDLTQVKAKGLKALNPVDGMANTPDQLIDFKADLINMTRAALDEANTSARLLLNEVNLSGGVKGCAKKRQAVLELLDRLADRNAPLDGVCPQSHISSQNGVDIEEREKFIDALATRGLDVHISELVIAAANYEWCLGFSEQDYARVMGDLTAVPA